MASSIRTLSLIAVTAALFAGCVRPIPKPGTATLETADADPAGLAQTGDILETAADVEVGDVQRVKVTTDQGEFIIEVHPEWAPIGAAHWLKLVKEGFYNDTRFFRVVPDFMAQTGLSGDPTLNTKHGEATIRDDRVIASNKRGYVTFAQTGQPHSRSTQWFINFKDNSFLDNSGQGFMPFGKVIEGMGVVDRISPEHGERPDQFRAKSEGNAYLDEQFPGLTKIVSIELIDEESAEEPAAAPSEGEPESAESEPEQPTPEQ